MKFKYMLRGLGIGVIITACVMGAYTRSAVADARVAVLKEYGLGEETVLVENTEDTTESVEESNNESSEIIQSTEQIIIRDEEKESEINSVIDEAIQTETGNDIVTETAEEVESFEETETLEMSSVEETEIIVVPTEQEEIAGGFLQIEVLKGDDSGTVSRKLYNAGIIENASEYDAFLMQHGYDKKISTGVKTIYLDDSWQDIAQKLTSK